MKKKDNIEIKVFISLTVSEMEPKTKLHVDSNKEKYMNYIKRGTNAENFMG